MMICARNARPILLALLTSISAFQSWAASDDTDAALLTNIWIVKTSGSALPASTLLEWTANDLGQLGSLQGFYKIDFSKSKLSPETVGNLLSSHEDVLWFEQQKRDQKVTSETMMGVPTDDPSFGEAWHITNSGQKNGKKGEDLNLLPTWDWGLDGTGTLIAVVDTGIEMSHPDLAANIRSDLALDLIGSGSSVNQLEPDENHGTAVAGIIAAVDNQIGSIGVAYGAHLVPIRYIGESHTDSESAEVLSHLRNLISIYNNSWGPSLGEDGDEVGLTGASSLGRLALAEGASSGRGGRGNLFVFSAGNDAEAGANVNYNSWANSRYTIAVAAIGNGGKHVSYSEPGAPVLVCAPSGGQSLGIFTTDRAGSYGYTATDYYASFSGTSASAPMVSGVIALMLQANPLLGWRDVQHILVKTAIQVDSQDSGWSINGAGLPFNDKYGFGRVDSSAAIQAAAAWKNVTAEKSVSSSKTASLMIPVNGAPVESAITLSRNLRVEQVVVTPTLNHSDWGDLRITLISPSGTESVLAQPHSDAIGSYTSWDYSSVQFWDETCLGTWKLRLEDLSDQGTGSLARWTIRVYGTDLATDRNADPIANPDFYVTTDYPAILPVLSNDTEPDGDAMVIVSLYQPEHGSLAINENEELVYTPDPSTFQGIDQFGYTVSDGRGGSSDTLVNITHPGPVAVSDQAVVIQGGSTTIPVLANDFDRSDDPVALVSVNQPEYGTAEIVDQQVIYTPDADFIGHETFSYTITDNHDGESSSTIRVFTSGDADFALLFDGIDDDITFAHNEAFNIASAITLEASFYLRSYGENDSVGFGRLIDRDTYSLLVNGTEHTKYPDHCLVFAVELPDGSTATANTPAESILINRWHKVAVTYDGQKVRMYVDGKQVETIFSFDTPFLGPIASKTANLHIGENEAGTRAFDGIIDWIRVWNKVLTADEVADYDLFVDLNNRSGLVGWFQFNEGTGWQTLEAIGNGGNGKITEALWVPKDPSMLSTAIAKPESN